MTLHILKLTHFSRWNARWNARCTCGWASDSHDSRRAARGAFANHVTQATKVIP